MELVGLVVSFVASCFSWVAERRLRRAKFDVDAYRIYLDETVDRLSGLNKSNGELGSIDKLRVENLEEIRRLVRNRLVHFDGAADPKLLENVRQWTHAQRPKRARAVKVSDMRLASLLEPDVREALINALSQEAADRESEGRSSFATRVYVSWCLLLAVLQRVRSVVTFAKYRHRS